MQYLSDLTSVVLDCSYYPRKTVVVHCGLIRLVHLADRLPTIRPSMYLDHLSQHCRQHS